MTTLLFAGPSLPPGLPLPASIALLPPARAGDLIAAARDRPRAIGLVDGVFEEAPAVGHAEIGWVLAQGIPVLGAASLGALRAAELAALGMVGVGRVYAAYRDGTIERDDAVMVETAPAALGYRALTLALVDAEASLAAADLPPAERKALVAIARACNFRSRSWSAIVAAYATIAGAAAADAAERAIAAAAFSQKQRDVAALIAVLAGGDVARPPAFDRPMTSFLRALIARATDHPASASPASASPRSSSSRCAAT